MGNHDEKRLHQLASRLCDGEADAAQRAELAELLDGNEQALAEYRDFTALHLLLSQQAEEALAEDAATPVAAPVELAAASPSDPPPARRRKSRAWGSAALAASVLLALFFTARQALTGAGPPARIVTQVDCTRDGAAWSPASPELQWGDAVHIDAGVLVIAFRDGAEVVLEGPVRFQLAADKLCELTTGRLSADVPPGAEGFTVSTPLGKVIDLGTRFGVRVDGAERLETHVFAGRVEYRRAAAEPDAAPAPVEVAAGDAIVVTASSDAIARTAADESAFVVAPRLARAPRVAPASVAVESSAGSPVLRLDAAQLVQLDAQQRLVSWGNLAAAKSDGFSSRDAWQVDPQRRPRWVEQLHADRAAIRFDGRSSLTTAPLDAGDEFTVACVCQSRDAGPRNAGRPVLLSCADAAARLQIELRQTGAETEVRTVATTDAGRTVLARATADAAAPLVIALSYSRSQQQSVMCVNGEIYRLDAANAPFATGSSWQIGRGAAPASHLHGDVYELLAFDQALSPEQTAKLVDALMAKYSLTAKPREPRILSGLVPESE